MYNIIAICVHVLCTVCNDNWVMLSCFFISFSNARRKFIQFFYIDNKKVLGSSYVMFYCFSFKPTFLVCDCVRVRDYDYIRIQKKTVTFVVGNESRHDCLTIRISMKYYRVCMILEVSNYLWGIFRAQVLLCAVCHAFKSTTHKFVVSSDLIHWSNWSLHSSSTSFPS